MILGVDVSHHQGEIDWASVATSDVRFAYVKASEGLLTDMQFFANWRELSAQPLLRGAYHYARPSRSRPLGAVTDADHFADLVGNPTAAGVLPPALDLETSGDLSPAAMLDWVRVFVSRVETIMGREIVIYTGKFWRDFMGDPVVPELGTRMLWTARYGAASALPVVPKTWSRWDFWQFTDGVYGDARRIPGIRGSVDCDWWRGELAELQQLANVQR